MNQMYVPTCLREFGSTQPRAQRPGWLEVELFVYIDLLMTTNGMAPTAGALCALNVVLRQPSMPERLLTIHGMKGYIEIER